MPVLQFKGKTAIECYHPWVPHQTLEFDSELSEELEKKGSTIGSLYPNELRQYAPAHIRARARISCSFTNTSRPSTLLSVVSPRPELGPKGLSNHKHEQRFSGLF